MRKKYCGCLWVCRGGEGEMKIALNVVEERKREEVSAGWEFSVMRGWIVKCGEILMDTEK